MYLSATAKRGLMILGVALLAVIGLLGWIRRGTPVSSPLYTPNPQNYTPAPTTAPPENPGPVSAAPGNAEPFASVNAVGADAAPAVVYAASPFGSDLAAPPSPPPAPVIAAPATTSQASLSSSHRVRNVQRSRHVRVITKKRPLRRSLEIVGGSAAGGALIGALAGGGKGAGIGALAGGAGGFVYDRLTHKKKKVVVSE